MDDPLLPTLSTLTQLQAQHRELAAQRERAIEQLLGPEVYAQYQSICLEFTSLEHTLDADIAEAEADLKGQVIRRGIGLSGQGVDVVFMPGRSTWDSKGLGHYISLHPEVAAYRRQGEPFVVIRKSRH
jgi:hypothetical protein